METIVAERRRPETSTDPIAGNPAGVVRQGIFLQTLIGTAGAVEYLKSRQVKGRVISRVLSGGAVREGDRAGPDAAKPPLK